MAPRARNLVKSVHSLPQALFQSLMVEERKIAGLTQQALASHLRKPQSFIAKYERGERRLDVLEFLTVCEAIGVDPVKVLNKLTKRLQSARK